MTENASESFAETTYHLTTRTIWEEMYLKKFIKGKLSGFQAKNFTKGC